MSFAQAESSCGARRLGVEIDAVAASNEPLAVQRVAVTVEELLRRYGEGERDFSRLDLRNGDALGRGPNVAGAVLRGASFTEANLTDVFLANADLQGANLTGAELRKADFSGANLVGANLSRANLFDANLFGAKLGDADLSEAFLHNAILTHADLHGARLTEASLRNADVTHADLSSASLGGADLSQADFSSANLSNASLSEATLWEAKFGEANLTAANLRRARVTSADFTYTNLDAANFTEADLTGAMLWAARLDRTNLTRAELGATLLIELDLRTAIGLETILHRSGSVVDRRTLRASGGNLPETFLRGCGFSDWEIAATRLYDAVRRDDDRISMINEILRSQRERPSGFSSVFISYSSVDQEFVTKLHDDLQNAGVRCWFDRDDMRSGQKLHEQVERGIRKHDRLLLVLSAASMSSTWVKSEIASARQKEREQQHRVLFPIRLVSIDAIRKWKQFDADIGDDSARELREYFIPDFGAWRNADVYQAAFERLLNDLRRDDAGIDG